jgi:RHS repeat-associated protein
MYDAWGVKIPLFNPDRQKGTPEHRNKYNGKEYLSDLGWYEYGFRMFDPAIGRWHVIDALSENHYDLTGYNYVMNNPLRYIDPFGLDTLDNTAANFNYSLVNTGDVLINGGIVLDEAVAKAKPEKKSREQQLLERFQYGFLTQNEYDNRDYHPYMPDAIGIDASLSVDAIFARGGINFGAMAGSSTWAPYISGFGGGGFKSGLPKFHWSLRITLADRVNKNSEFNILDITGGATSTTNVGLGLDYGYGRTLLSNGKLNPDGYRINSFGLGTGISQTISATILTKEFGL